MADDERRMLFDIRGRRKRVVQVAYAALAVLMALSLFTVAGPGITDIFGTGGTDTGSDVFDEQAENLERRLRKDPRNEGLLVSVARTRYTAGNNQLEYDQATGALTGVPEEAVENFRKSAEAWKRYLKLEPAKPNAGLAGLVATALFFTAATSTTPDQFDENLGAAVEAQEIYAEAKPSLNAYVTLARYSYFAGDEKAGDAAARKAEQEAPEAQQASIKQATEQYAKEGRQIQKQVKAQSKFNPGAGGKQALEDPLGGLSGGGGLGAPAP